MTANPDATLEGSGAERSGFLHSSLGRAIVATLFGLVALFLLGVATGVSIAAIERGSLSTKGVVALIISAVVGLVMASFAYGRIRAIMREPVGKRTKRARTLTIASVLLGIGIGLALSLGGRDGNPMIDGGALTPEIAIILALVAVIAVPMLTWGWWRALDEHEAGAYSDGALIALNFYASITAAWWLLERASMIEPIQPMTIFLLTLGVWSAVWAWKRYR
ncbi:hypothetical protein [Croceicoccus naphthovorans]|uniref:Uncharacterized protein n=1 Tax=Croceicoccus naphthovorans TaxID=1348774 RepID=A0A0G3XHJ1_9SPHN|nr:hypothetical protein [Croceicoccus naphthovorans]AKM10071.1 hypothetical protein AB433_08930 [Croceicoccus naphthovorans]MBB3991211.1 ABC-type antimicrobial peptide transport system permease subunit [Croceicoccus naphthovorans]